MTHVILIEIDTGSSEERNKLLIHDFETALGSHRRLDLVRLEEQDDVDPGEYYTRVYGLSDKL